ncbi:hypothetical protein HMPREF3038_02039 [Akkermansia sp. KLE1797]|nr:hypothetical protein HMPREF3038_02039 [Akkermansia sp. KLE1797]KXU53627.1 hypothetical protein HMPREF3039_02350 [Akkermansia sp. KLE1798]KZA05663.1 hypothetical protein HMPREF1326_00651 [Akkermansia sp. KLE1605]
MLPAGAFSRGGVVILAQSVQKTSLTSILNWLSATASSGKPPYGRGAGTGRHGLFPRYFFSYMRKSPIFPILKGFRERRQK